MPPFSYEHLNQNRHEIRLVQLVLPQFEDEHPSDKIASSGKLRLRLKSQALDEAPDYHRTQFSALSYCWNPLQQEPPSMHDIQINDHDFQVGYNLYDALKQFEQKSMAEWLWIDAICINQRDDAEKTWQIRQMRDIYQMSETVYMWLGKSNATDQIMDFVSEIGQEAVDCKGASMADPKGPSWISKWEKN